MQSGVNQHSRVPRGHHTNQSQPTGARLLWVSWRALWRHREERPPYWVLTREINCRGGKQRMKKEGWRWEERRAHAPPPRSKRKELKRKKTTHTHTDNRKLSNRINDKERNLKWAKQGRENGKGGKTKTSRNKKHLYFPLLHRFFPDLLVVGADLEAEQEKRGLMMRIERTSMFVLMPDRQPVISQLYSLTIYLDEPDSIYWVRRSLNMI